MRSVMGAFAEFERALIKKRQREGIALARPIRGISRRFPLSTPPSCGGVAMRVSKRPGWLVRLASAARRSINLSERGADTTHFPVAERDYIEKIIQVPFTLPPLNLSVITTFRRSRLPSVPGLSDEERSQVAQLMTAGLLRNLRKVKRSFNIFRLQLSLDRLHGRITPAGLIAKLTVIQSSFADLYERIARDPLLLHGVEQIVRGTPGPVRSARICAKRRAGANSGSRSCFSSRPSSRA
jgi:KAP family P-loop domain